MKTLNSSRDSLFEVSFDIDHKAKSKNNFKGQSSNQNFYVKS